MNNEIDSMSNNEETVQNGLPSVLRKVSERSVDGYEAGAIRRIVLENFVTYRHAEFTIGPSLNMIIGPNGSGKSTIVCAICLGLGGKPEILGRSKTPQEFIKHGQSSATITIELQGFPNKQNIIITRTINPTGNVWRINGRSSTAKEILKTVSNFNIQIDNLCQFLPQDRVASFAQLPSTELLLETERAVGSKQMIENHQTLISLNDSRTIAEESLVGKSKMFEEFQNLQGNDEEIINRYRERQDNLQKLEILKAGVIILEYREAQSIKQIASQNTAEVRERFNQLSAKKDSFQTKAEELRNQETDFNNDSESVKLEKRAKLEFGELTKMAIKEGTRDIIEIKYDIETAKSKRAQRESEINSLEKEIQGILRAKDAQPTPDPEILDRLTEEAQQLRSMRREFDAQLKDLDEDEKEVASKRNIINSSLENTNRKLQQMSTVDQTRLNFMRSKGKGQMADTYNAIIWLREHKNLFKETVYEPPIIVLEYKDESLLDIVSATIDGNTMLTFTALNREDYVTFTSEVMDKLGLSVSIREYSNTRAPTFQQQSLPYSPQELESYGFTGVVLSLLSAPAPVLNMLCHNSKVNMIPYCATNLSDNQLEKINSAISSYGDPLFSKYFDRKYFVAVIRSRHGKKNISNSSAFLRPATDNFIVKGARSSEVDSILSEIEEYKKNLENFSKRIDEIHEAKREVNNQRVPIMERMAENRENAERYKSAELVHKKLEARYQMNCEKLDDLKSRPDTTKADQEKFTKRLRECTRNLKSNTDKIKKISKDLIKLSLEHRTILCDRDSISNALGMYERFATSGLEEVTRQLEEAEIEEAKARENFKAIKREVKASNAALPPELLEEVKAIYHDTAKTVESLTEERDRLEYTLKTSEDHEGEAAMKRYEGRRGHMETLKNEIEELNTQISDFSSKISIIHEKWKPELEAIVQTISQQFSEAFKSIKCQGEVRLGHTDQPYKDWSMDILVSFREGAEMQILTHQLQSGGERAVSTIFYLIALQRITKSPFRVVDEINQGMDPRNERVVHGHMVEVACAHDSSQYFLITPKLLQDLRYDPKMKVHTIFSGHKVEDVSTYEHPPTSTRMLLANLRAAAAQ